MALTQIDDRGLKTPIDLLDNEKIRFGTGNDLELFHDGTDSKIFNHTGTFKINANDFLFKDKNEGDTFAKFIHDGAVELYYDGSSKFETFSWGARVHGNLSLIDNKIAYFGTNNDLQIYHDGGNSWVKEAGTGALYIDTDGSVIALTKGGANETLAKFYTDGAVELYYDNSKKLETGSAGVTVTGNIYTNGNVNLTADDKKIRFGADEDLEIYHSGGINYITSPTDKTIKITAKTGEDGVKVVADDTVELYHNNVKKFETTSNGITVTGNYIGSDWIKAQADNKGFTSGASDDLQIYHDGTTNRVHSVSKALLIKTIDGYDLTLQTNSENAVVCKGNAAVELYYNGTKHFETNSGGVKVNDNLYVGFGNGNDLQIKHDGSNNLIESTGANNWIKTSGTQGFANGSEYEIKCIGNQGVELFYDNSVKLETTSWGTKSSGRLEAVADGSSTNYTSPSAFLAYSSNSNDEHAAEIFQGRYNKRCLTCSNPYDGTVTYIGFKSNDATCGSIYSTNANTTVYATSSDYRLKENEVAISDGISRLKTLKPYRFNFKNKKDVTVDGFFAHEVTAVPEAVIGEKDGAEMQQIDQSKLVPLLVASLQEAIAKIETLETEVAALKG